MKLAIVHDWIGEIGGAERVLKEMTSIWPDAPVYALFVNPKTVEGHLLHTVIHTSWLQRVPGIRWLYPYLAPLLPSAMESFDLSAYDTVLSSSVMFAKGVIVRPGTRHICYCYSPSRMLWDRAVAYERHGIWSSITRHILRLWDHSASRRPDQFVAISQTVADRIKKYYQRDSVIVSPPVRPTNGYQLMATGLPPFFLIVARLVPHKNLAMVVEAFHKLTYRLIIVGDGPLGRTLKKQAPGNVEFRGWVSDDQLDMLYQECSAVIVPNEEDFGLTAIEAMTYGKPVLALRRGGATETVHEGVSGLFFDDPIPEALADGVRRMHATLDRYNLQEIQYQAALYSPERFARELRAIVEQP